MTIRNSPATNVGRNALYITLLVLFVSFSLSVSLSLSYFTLFYARPTTGFAGATGPVPNFSN
jgi:predicted MFS family arabinose efflux permease